MRVVRDTDKQFGATAVGGIKMGYRRRPSFVGDKLVQMAFINGQVSVRILFVAAVQSKLNDNVGSVKGSTIVYFGLDNFSDVFYRLGSYREYSLYEERKKVSK